MGYRTLFVILISLIIFSVYFGKIEKKHVTELPPSQSEESGGGEKLKPAFDRSKHNVGNKPSAGDSVEFIIESPPISDLESEISAIKEMDYMLGSKDSKVVLIEYSSPTCPHCSFFHKTVFPKLKEKYIDNKKIAYILREFVTNKQDLDSSILGRCYKNEQDPIKLLELFYIQQDSWAYSKNYKELLINMGKLAGVSPEKYNECENNQKMIEFLLNNARIIGEHPEIVGTPAFFINGKLYKDAYSLEGLSDAIDNALSEVGNSETKQSETKNQES